MNGWCLERAGSCAIGGDDLALSLALLRSLALSPGGERIDVAYFGDSTISI